MAQFSSLEQMMNMTESIGKVNEILTSVDSVNAVGKNVDIENGGDVISGFVTAAKRGEIPEVQVNGKWYLWKEVTKVYGNN